MSVVLHGGLGNQLFQYFYATLVHRAKRSSIVKLHLGFLSSYESARALELNPLISQRLNKCVELIYTPNFLINLRIPKVLNYLIGREYRIGFISLIYIIDGYFQKIRSYVDFSRIAIDDTLKDFRTLLIDQKLINYSDKPFLVHIRLGDFFSDSIEAKKHISSRLSKLDEDVDIITDQEWLISEFIAETAHSKNLKIVSTSDLDSWGVLRLMSSYRNIDTNGSSLAFWAAVFSCSNLITSNPDHQKLFDFLAKPCPKNSSNPAS